jgi:hypothetical protein
MFGTVERAAGRPRGTRRRLIAAGPQLSIGQRAIGTGASECGLR